MLSNHFFSLSFSFFISRSPSLFLSSQKISIFLLVKFPFLQHLLERKISLSIIPLFQIFSLSLFLLPPLMSPSMIIMCEGGEKQIMDIKCYDTTFMREWNSYSWKTSGSEKRRKREEEGREKEFLESVFLSCLYFYYRLVWRGETIFVKKKTQIFCQEWTLTVVRKKERKEEGKRKEEEERVSFGSQPGLMSCNSTRDRKKRSKR